MSEIASGTCTFCGRQASYQCDHQIVLNTWRCPGNLAGDPEHADHNYRWTQSCFASMCEAHAIEMDEGVHLCATHRPAPPEEAIRVVHKLKIVKRKKAS